MLVASWKCRIKYGCLLGVINIIACTTTVGQEYKYEIGGLAGLSMYMGDANKNAFFEGYHPSGGLVFRKNSNFRWAMKANLLMGRVSGDTQKLDNVFPKKQNVQFGRNFFELGGQIEFNFLPYSDKFAYLQTSKISPYILTGIGLTVAPGKDQTCISLAIPLGIGVKYKVKNRINIGCDYSFRKLFTDALDTPNKEGFGLNNPYDIKSGWMKNKDWYSLILFFITWDFGPNDRKCSNL